MKHIKFECKKPCEKQHCNYCDGDLFLCIVCNLAEGSLTTDCPGYIISGESQAIIYDNHNNIDFIDGKWSGSLSVEMGKTL